MAATADKQKKSYHMATDWWSQIINQAAAESDDPAAQPLTDPQLRRVLQILVADGRVKETGRGRKGWKVVTLQEKMEAKKEAAQAERWREFKGSLARMPIPYALTWSTHHLSDMSATREEFGSDQLGILISPQSARALMEMLEDFPGIAAQYFDFEEVQDG
jgi:hypothetical protein